MDNYWEHFRSKFDGLSNKELFERLTSILYELEVLVDKIERGINPQIDEWCEIHDIVRVGWGLNDALGVYIGDLITKDGKVNLFYYSSHCGDYDYLQIPLWFFTEDDSREQAIANYKEKQRQQEMDRRKAEETAAKYREEKELYLKLKEKYDV